MAAIWVHAEPFGYGPSALALTILPGLRRLGARLEYVGRGLGLELNTSPPWDRIHDCDVSGARADEALGQLMLLHRPSLVVSIVDEPFAQLVARLGLARLVVIDQLLWSWPSIPRPWRQAARVIAVDYVGVRERIRRDGLHNAVVVPPLLPSKDDAPRSTGPRKGTLINLGGLQNPFTPLSENVAYAELVLRTVKAAVEARGRADDLPLRCLVSRDVGAAIDSDLVSSTTPAYARSLLAQSKTAFMTSGRTNIYDAADCGARVVFLPPTNKTQALQPRLLQDELGCSVARIDWHDVNVALDAIDYRSPGEEACFPLIRRHQDAVLQVGAARRRFLDLVLESFEAAPDNAVSLQTIFTELGRDDGTLVAKAIADSGLGFCMSET